MAAAVDVTSTTSQQQRLDTAQELGAFRFGDNNFGTASGSSGPGFSLTPLTTTLLVAGVLVAIWLWTRKKKP